MVALSPCPLSLTSLLMLLSLKDHKSPEGMDCGSFRFTASATVTALHPTFPQCTCRSSDPKMPKRPQPTPCRGQTQPAPSNPRASWLSLGVNKVSPAILSLLAPSAQPPSL